MASPNVGYREGALHQHSGAPKGGNTLFLLPGVTSLAPDGARQTLAPCLASPSQGCTGSKQPGPGQGSAADGEPVLTFRLLKDRASLGPSLFSPSDSPSRPATAADPEIQVLACVRPNLQIDVLSQRGRANTTAAAVEARHQDGFSGSGREF